MTQNKTKEWHIRDTCHSAEKFLIEKEKKTKKTPEQLLNLFR